MSKNVLIVEDEGLVSMELQENLERLGHTVVGVVDNGEQAITMAHRLNPDLILMDIRLHGAMDGVEAATTIRKSTDIPIIFLTAYSGDEILRRAMITEPYAYLLKPIQEQQLESALRIAWYRHGRDQIRERNVERFVSILKALPHGVVVVDRELKVRYLNNRAKRIIGLTTKESWGRPVGEVVIIRDTRAAEMVRTHISAVLTEDKSGSVGEHKILSHLNDVKSIILDIAPFAAKDGENLGALLILTELLPHGNTASEMLASEDEENRPLFTTSEYYPPATEMGQLRSYLEIEIIRQALSEPPEDGYNRGFVDGQLNVNKTLLQMFFGEEAVAEIEAILANE